MLERNNATVLVMDHEAGLSDRSSEGCGEDQSPANLSFGSHVNIPSVHGQTGLYPCKVTTMTTHVPEVQVTRLYDINLTLR